MDFVKNRNNHKYKRFATIYVVRVAFMAALLTVLKFALSFIPNVELVTMLIIVYASTLGIIYALPATLVFCCVEIAIYGIGSWTILYFIYWPLLAIIGSLLLKQKNMAVALLIGVIGSILFGVLSACTDTILCVNNLTNAELQKYWVAYYLRGVYFDLIHVISNFAVILILYKPLCEVVKKIAPTSYVSPSIKVKMILLYQIEYFREG